MRLFVCNRIVLHNLRGPLTDRGEALLDKLTKKPLPEKRLISSAATIALIFQKFTSAGIGTENWVLYPKRLPGFHRAGPFTPLDEHRVLFSVGKKSNMIIPNQKVFVKSNDLTRYFL
jgi:hypothetical protein